MTIYVNLHEGLDILVDFSLALGELGKLLITFFEVLIDASSYQIDLSSGRVGLDALNFVGDHFENSVVPETY